jgi:putative sterol carrier protein
MAGDATSRFFEQLDRRGHEPLLEKMEGVVRFDLREDALTDHWLVRIEKGDVSVLREEREADAVVGSNPELFEAIVRGEENALAAMLRGAMTVSGNLQLILRLERLLPGPPGSHGPRRAISTGERP